MMRATSTVPDVTLPNPLRRFAAWHTRARQLRHGAMAAALLALSAAGPARAEPVVDQALSQLQVVEIDGCSLLRIDFNLRIRYAGHFPTTTGRELRVTVQPVDSAEAQLLRALRREALRAPAGPARIKSIDLESDQPGGPVLRIQFDRDMRFDAAQGADFQSIVVAVAPTGGRLCAPRLPAGPGGRWDTSVTINGDFAVAPAPKASGGPSAGGAHGRGTGTASKKDIAAADGHMQAGRAALRSHDYAAAAGHFRKVLALPETPVSADAQEMLALSYQKSGRLAEARAELEDYLVRYPTAEASERARQRLDAILTRDAAAGERLAKPRSAERSGETTWTVSGSASQFYIRDDSFRTLRDPSLPPNPNEDADAHRVHVNTMLTGLDLTATMSNADMKAKFRFSGTEEVRFAQERELTGVAALFLDLTLRDYGLETRVGRQTRNTGGVQGRFDGALASWQATPWLRLNAVGGSPVVSRFDEPFKDDRWLYGVSADFGPFLGGFDASLFVIEQRDRWLLDRQAVGTELRYIDSTKSAFLTIDYDLHFKELNAAIFSTSWTLADKTNLHAGLDYRKAPYLSAWTALQNQPFQSLYGMLQANTKAEIDQLAIDRTPTYRAANAGLSVPITTNLQATLDITAASITGTPASGGVPEMPGTGWELYTSAQLIAQNLVSEGDLYIAGVRIANRADSDLYVLDLSARYPLTRDLRINPRLQLGYRVGDAIALTEYTVMPSVLFNYYWTPELSFELETGVRWTETHQGTATETSTDVFVTAGVRYDFYAEGRTPCVSFQPCPQRR